MAKRERKPGRQPGEYLIGAGGKARRIYLDEATWETLGEIGHAIGKATERVDGRSAAIRHLVQRYRDDQVAKNDRAPDRSGA